MVEKPKIELKIGYQCTEDQYTNDHMDVDPDIGFKLESWMRYPLSPLFVSNVKDETTV